MATELFDPASIDAAVNDAFGITPRATPKVNLTGLEPNLANALTQAQAAYRNRYGTELPITSGVRTRADQERLFREAKAGKAGIYMPVDPSKYPGREFFHTDAIDIPTSVSESFLNEFGIHRPLGRRDPVHAMLMPPAKAPKQAATVQLPNLPPSMQPPPRAQPTDASQWRVDVAGVSDESMAEMRAAEKTPSQLTVEDLMKPEAIDAAVAEAFSTPPPPSKTEKAASAVGEKVRSFLRSSAALADTLYSPVPGLAGMVTYAGARAAGETEEQALARKATVVGTLERPVGKAAGVTETPEYKAEVSQRLAEFISENVGKGADWISEKTGIPKGDVEYYLELGMMGAPFSRTGQRVGQAVRTEAGYAAEAALTGARAVTPQAIQRPIARAAEAVAPGITQRFPPARPTPITPPVTPSVTSRVEPQVPAFGSVGAAAVPDIVTIRQALQSATPEFQQMYGNMPLDKANKPVLMRDLEADSLPIPMRLTEGMATQDPVKISREQNLRGQQPELAYHINKLNEQLVENVPLIRERAAPDVYATKTIESSQALIDAYKALDDTRNAEISKAYQALEDAAGGEFPVDGVTLAQNAEAALAKKLKTDFLPSGIKNQLERFKNGEPMTFEQFEAMRTNLAAEIRKAERTGDGNAAMASSIVREALENLPLKGEAAALKPLADTARSLAKSRFDALKKDPAYKAAVDDTVPADKYFDKFVIGGINKNINTMVNTLGRESVAHQHMKAGTINWLSDKAGIIDGRGNFSQANYNKAVKKLDDMKNFQAIFDPESQLQLRTLGNVAAYTQFQPRGAFVNNSNTLVAYLASKGAGALEQAGNIAGLKTFGYPLGSEARRVIRSARERQEVQKALQPGAGRFAE